MTRLGVVSDIHANLHALDAALEFLATQELDGYLCAGDLVGYGPLPNECINRMLDLPVACVAGNHDLIALGRLGDDRCIPLARDSLRWTRSVLDDDARARLEALPLSAHEIPDFDRFWHAVRPALDARLDALCLKALAKKPEGTRRFLRAYERAVQISGSRPELRRHRARCRV